MRRTSRGGSDLSAQAPKSFSSDPQHRLNPTFRLSRASKQQGTLHSPSPARAASESRRKGSKREGPIHPYLKSSGDGHSLRCLDLSPFQHLLVAAAVTANGSALFPVRSCRPRADLQTVGAHFSALLQPCRPVRRRQTQSPGRWRGR